MSAGAAHARRAHKTVEISGLRFDYCGSQSPGELLLVTYWCDASSIYDTMSY